MLLTRSRISLSLIHAAFGRTGGIVLRTRNAMHACLVSTSFGKTAVQTVGTKIRFGKKVEIWGFLEGLLRLGETVLFEYSEQENSLNW